MANSTAPVSVNRHAVAFLQLPVAASTYIASGACVAVNASGYAVPADDTSGNRFVGQARGTADNSGGSAAAITVDVDPPDVVGALELACAAADITWVTKKVFFSDDHTVTLAAGSTNKVVAGEVVKFISATRVLVNLRARFTLATAA